MATNALRMLLSQALYTDILSYCTSRIRVHVLCLPYHLSTRNLGSVTVRVYRHSLFNLIA